MMIDRHNYEEFFILYLDNELSDADRRMVEAFVSLHPDLNEELELLSQFKLQPDTTVGFPGKESLLRSEAQKEISTEDLLLHLDDELGSEQSSRLQQVIDSNDHLQKEFSLLRKTKLAPEEIPFPGKSVLYRKTAEPARIIPVRWYRVAAAVILLILAGSTLVLLNNRNQNSDVPELVKTQQSGTEKMPVTNDIQKETLLAKEEITSPGKNEPASLKNVQQEKKQDVLVKTNPVAQPEQKQDMPEKISNNLPEPLNNRNAIALNENRPIQTVDPENNFSNKAVTSLSPQPLDIVQASLPAEDDDEFQEPSGGKKNKLRGLFRKVTRTLEKRTNIDATDNEDRLLVAGLAIKLK